LYSDCSVHTGSGAYSTSHTEGNGVYFPYCVFEAMKIWDISVCIVTVVSTPALGPTQPRIQSLMRPISLKVKLNTDLRFAEIQNVLKRSERTIMTLERCLWMFGCPEMER
jgi:hypothetical protein